MIPSSVTPRVAQPSAGFTVAVSHRSKHNGEWQDVNDGFFRCTAWRSNAGGTHRDRRDSVTAENAAPATAG